MGAYGSKHLKKPPVPEKERPIKLLFAGPEGSGKSHLLHRLKDEVFDPDTDYSWMERIDIIYVDGMKIVCWLPGKGRERARPMMFRTMYYRGTKGLVYVIDSNDKEKIDEGLHEIYEHMIHELTQDMVMMVCANKQDLDGAFSAQDIEDKIKEKLSPLEPKLGGRTLFVKGCSAETKEGIDEAFSSLKEAICLKKLGKLSPGIIKYEAHSQDKDTQMDIVNDVRLETETDKIKEPELDKAAETITKKGTENYGRGLKKLLHIPFVKTFLCD